MKKFILVLFILPVCIALVSFAMQQKPEIKITQQDIELVQDYLAQCLELAKKGNMQFPKRNGLQLTFTTNTYQHEYEGQKFYIRENKLMLLSETLGEIGDVDSSIFSWDPPHVANITGVYIDKKFRGGGLGQYLISIAALILMNHGYTQIKGIASPRDPEYLSDPAMQKRLSGMYERFGAQQEEGGLGLQAKDIMPDEPSEQELQRQRELEELKRQARERVEKMKAAL